MTGLLSDYAVVWAGVLVLLLLIVGQSILAILERKETDEKGKP